MSRVLKSPRHGLSLQANAGCLPVSKRTAAASVRVLYISSFSDHPIANATEIECLKISLNRIYIPIYTYTRTHTYIHTHTYINTYIHTYTHTYIHTHKNTYVRTYIPINTYIRTYIHKYIRTYFMITPCIKQY